MLPSPDLAPLARFLTPQQIASLQITPAEPAALPSDARQLLVHEGDMTSRLEAFHGEPLRVRALRVQPPETDPGTYAREVILETCESHRPVEYGAIVIELGAVGADLRAAITEAREPLGAILEGAGLPMASQPAAFFRADADAYLAPLLGVVPGAILHGRRNRLLIDGETTVAEIVEIVPQ
ncbi:MAG: hypothetical protein AAGK14_12310 [Verrucomicrobiota bacterium]